MGEPCIHRLTELPKIRSELARGDNATHVRLNELRAEWEHVKGALRPGDGDEALALADSGGRPMPLTAPRWLCHLLGLRHHCVHLLLEWQSPRLGRVFVLQIRSWIKPESPGRVDISVGGHVQGQHASDSVAAISREMEEELGLTLADLVGKRVYFCKGYENYEERPEDNFYNSEYCAVYIASVTSNALERLRFNDREVAGLYLCPVSDAENLLRQRHIPLASALRLSLPYCLEQHD